MLAGAVGHALDLGEHAVARVARPRARGRSSRRSSRGAGRRPAETPSAASSAQRAEVARAAGRAVDLAVGEDRHVALVQRAELLVEDRPVDARQALVVGVARRVGARERGLDRAPGGDQRRAGRRARRAARSARRGPRRRSRRRRPRRPRRRRPRTPRATTNDGTLRKATASTAPPRMRTRATTRPDGTSIVTSTSPSSRRGDRARTPPPTRPSAIVPCPHAVE